MRRTLALLETEGVGVVRFGILALALAACASTPAADPWPLHAALSDPVVSGEGEVHAEGEPGGKTRHEAEVGHHFVNLF
ncbi:MAG: hypothetical protein ACYS0K_12295, partial [Planctomycetota bacterium]